MNLNSYQTHYSDGKFRRKMTVIRRSAGCKVFKQALLLYVTLTEQAVPRWVKASIVGALGYLICPLDLVPDFLPGGYLDDLAVMAMVMGRVCAYDTPNARERMQKLLPERCRKS